MLLMRFTMRIQIKNLKQKKCEKGIKCILNYITDRQVGYSQYTYNCYKDCCN